MEGNGYIEVADFITVVYYDKEKFPNGVRKFSTKQTQGQERVAVEQFEINNEPVELAIE